MPSAGSGSTGSESEQPKQDKSRVRQIVSLDVDDAATLTPQKLPNGRSEKTV
jgi:hypothetical protein